MGQYTAQFAILDIDNSQATYFYGDGVDDDFKRYSR